MITDRVVVVGAGVGGLTAAAILAKRGFEVHLLEKEPHLGGKLRTESVAGAAIDVGPTVLTMRWTIERAFEAAGAQLSDYVTLEPLPRIARHVFRDGSELDLFPEVDLTVEAIRAFAGKREAEGYRAFAAYCARIFELVNARFLAAQRPSLTSLLGLAGTFGPSAFVEIDAHRTMAASIEKFFVDPRLRQLFARYATYVGSSPYSTPATLHVIAHVERSGVWSVEGGMVALASGLERVAAARGVTVRKGVSVRELLVRSGRARGVVLEDGTPIEAAAVVFAGDSAALAKGLLGAPSRRAVKVGPRRSLSALTVAAHGTLEGVSLDRHTVVFSPDYRAEHDALRAGRLPADPTIYVCAADRGRASAPSGAERLFFIMNAPATGELGSERWSTAAAEEELTKGLARSGIQLRTTSPLRVATPATLALRYPGSNGAIYGDATESMLASLQRPSARTPIERLILAGGTVHPGAGVPMAMQSGHLAADEAEAQLRSTSTRARVAMHGGTWMR